MREARTTPLIGRFWIRTTLALSLVLIATLGVVVVSVYQLSLASERTDLDEVLVREGSIVSRNLVDEVQRIIDGGNGGDLSSEDFRNAASRVLAIHPGSALHLVVVRWGDQALSSVRGPNRLVAVRAAGQLPRPTPGRLESSGGIRSRSQPIEFPGLRATVETIGDYRAIVDDARSVAGTTLLAALFGGFVGLGVLSLAVRRSTRLISAVSEAVRETQLDHLSHRIEEPNGRHEVAILARDVNMMLDDLDRSRTAREELVAAVSHEIRTPLAAARGHMDLIREGRAVDPAATIVRIDRELSRMTRLVDDLLALSRSADPRWIIRRLVNVKEILGDLAERVGVFEDRTVSFEEAPDLVVDADADRLLQALSNLIVNSMVHTPNGTRTTVSVRIEASNVGFVVSDDGPGIPSEVLDRVGQSFVRGSVSGTGLGLAVSRSIAVAHGGKLDVRSDLGGTEVTIWIPVDVEW